MPPTSCPAGGVYTIHVQSTGLRFATGGADSLVKVWSMAPVMDVQREAGGPLLLATLSDHASTVNAVRFSSNGRHLASGAPLGEGVCRGDWAIRPQAHPASQLRGCCAGLHAAGRNLED